MYSALDASADDEFGTSVSLSESVLMVGAPLADVSPLWGEDQGAVYYFDCVGWQCFELQKIVAGDAQPGDGFGFSVAHRWQGELVVGASADDHDGKDYAGSAYTFIKDETLWVQESKLTPSVPGDFALFGQSVAITDGLIVVGAVLDNAVGSDSGAAYVFRRSDSGWTEVERLTASDTAAGDWVGGSVSLSGDTLLVGAPGEDPGDKADAGAAYVFVWPLFVDGFETGDCTAWSIEVP
jgi:hypothetical protein